MDHELELMIFFVAAGVVWLIYQLEQMLNDRIVRRKRGPKS